jgi:hypothetical protein
LAALLDSLPDSGQSNAVVAGRADVAVCCIMQAEEAQAFVMCSSHTTAAVVCLMQVLHEAEDAGVYLETPVWNALLMCAGKGGRTGASRGRGRGCIFVMTNVCGVHGGVRQLAAGSGAFHHSQKQPSLQVFMPASDTCWC